MKGITTYSLSQNRQRPAAGMLYNAFFNTYRRAKAQVLYVLPPFIAAYALMDWATKKLWVFVYRVSDADDEYRNEYLMSKPGRLAHGGDDE
ncbi:hypothetical protein TRV_01325 [Trichophyton verrucosum HKI 0517]|uniref:Cytochrome b-c1 complex subunit 8 n=1 Tax=Trichophyton verrucosum (strain HKI 0517) TaxID=663202 RepID=D4D2M0_TRIVH|nr:uncharacterized protein TRV_01325 [Trichophyton verrucosum HKI 0517]EFE43884.1 hypothetical protein TRV_01325 [Trichophyton verrucosum HKI 0517]